MLVFHCILGRDDCIDIVSSQLQLTNNTPGLNMCRHINQRANVFIHITVEVNRTLLAVVIHAWINSLFYNVFYDLNLKPMASIYGITCDTLLNYWQTTSGVIPQTAIHMARCCKHSHILFPSSAQKATPQSKLKGTPDQG